MHAIIVDDYIELVREEDFFPDSVNIRKEPVYLNKIESLLDCIGIEEMIDIEVIA